MAASIVLAFRHFRLSLLSLSLLACGATWRHRRYGGAVRRCRSGTSRHVVAESGHPSAAGTADNRSSMSMLPSPWCSLRPHYEVHGLGTVVEGPPEKTDRCCKQSTGPRSKPAQSAR